MKRFGASNRVLTIICLMYLILYVDRVNISTAAPLIKADLKLSNTELGLAFRPSPIRMRCSSSSAAISATNSAPA